MQALGATLVAISPQTQNYNQELVKERRLPFEVVSDSGMLFTVPGSALPNVMPADGTKMLRDAEYFVFVKTDEGIEFMSPN